jgi:hypothetical protein
MRRFDPRVDLPIFQLTQPRCAEMVPSLRAPTAEKAGITATVTKNGRELRGETQSLQSLPKSSCAIDALQQSAAKAMQYPLQQSACLDGERRGEHDASIVGV